VSVSLDVHYNLFIRSLAEGRVVPFLGSDINLCGRPAGKTWQYGEPDYLPSHSELAKHLAENFAYPPSNGAPDLLRVSQYVAVTAGTDSLYQTLHQVLDGEYPPTPAHHFFAQLPNLLRQKIYSPRHQLIVTTNYDDLLERAFRAAGQSFDLVSYIAEGEHHGKFLHRSFEGDTTLIDRPNEYAGLSLERRSIILKIHGAIDRTAPERDSFVITEDHYLNFLTRTDISNLIPVTLAAKLRKSHFLFLGYSLRDWNLRIVLHRLWGEQKLIYKSWVVQSQYQEFDQKLWGQREVEILNVAPEDYLAELSARLQQLAPRGGGS
jgi:hypothetical protein